ncbi:MAG TPA: SRPBCC family protein [bacterium]|nr:SRPBCC family protein [bacterium]
MDHGCRRAVLVCLLAAGIAVAATCEERLARGEIVVTRLPAARKGQLGGRSQGVIAVPLDRVWAVLNRSNEFADYMPNFLVSWLVDRAAMGDIACRRWQRAELEGVLKKYLLADWIGDTVLFYNVLDMPFPVSDRWYLLEMTRDTTTHSISWSQVVGNLKSTAGSWQLAPWLDSVHTLATYTTVSEPGIALPAFVLDMGLNQSLPGVIKALRKRVAQPDKEAWE